MTPLRRFVYWWEGQTSLDRFAWVCAVALVGLWIGIFVILIGGL